MYLPHSHFYLGHAVGRDDYRDELRKYFDSELHEMKEAIESVQKTIDSLMQAARNPASSNKGPMLIILLVERQQLRMIWKATSHQVLRQFNNYSWCLTIS